MNRLRLARETEEDIYQLYEEVENDIFTHFTKALDDEKIVSYEDFYSCIVDYLLEDKNMGKMILQNLTQNGSLFIKLRDLFVQGCFDAWRPDRRTREINQALALINSILPYLIKVSRAFFAS